MRFIFLSLFIVLASVISQAQTYNCTYSSTIAAGASTVSTQVLSADPMRRCLVIYNPAGGTTVYIKFTSAHTGFEGFRMEPNTRWDPTIIPVNAIFTKMAKGATTITIMQGK